MMLMMIIDDNDAYHDDHLEEVHCIGVIFNYYRHHFTIILIC